MLTPKHLFCFLLLMLFFVDTYLTSSKSARFKLRGIKWWNLAAIQRPSNYIEQSKLPISNAHLQHLTKKQKTLTVKHPGVMSTVMRAARVAIHECQRQFKHRRWNCTVSKLYGSSIFGPIVKKGCRETAFIYAVTSAALAHGVATACAEGTIHTCRCNRDHHEQQEYLRRKYNRQLARAPSITNSVPHTFQWQGCDDNARFGKRFAKSFTGVTEKGSDLRYSVNRHNNEAGRLHSMAMEQQCKCHGMSGTCTFKTCWNRMKPFSLTGAALKKRFDGSSRVILSNAHYNGRSSNKKRDGGSSNRGGGRYKANFLPYNRRHKPPGRKDLVYYEDSPDFCRLDRTTGLRGTSGRQCNATSLGVDGCDLMCCGRGYRTRTFVRKKRCHCKFIWCCEVKCQTCYEQAKEHTCI